MAAVVVVVEGEGEVGDFDVSPGWRSALIAEGSRVVWVQRSVDELRMARAQLQQHFHLFLWKSLRASAEDVVAEMWISLGKCVNCAYIEGEAASQWMKFKRSMSCCCLLRK